MKLINNLKNNTFSMGPFSKTSDPAMVECMGLAGFDFFIIDLEHGPNTIEIAQNLIRAASLHGMTPVVRVGENNESQISKALDIGALGVQVPQINNEDDALKVVEAAKFSPLGKRGVCRYVRSAGYSSMEKDVYFKMSNENSLIILQIEGKEGIENLDGILDVDGVDIIFIGPYDLSQSLGLTGQISHPEVVKAMKDMVQKAKAKNKIVGTFVETSEDLKMWRDMGVLYLSYKVDVGIFYDACHAITSHYR
jgi:4-hydroxy-2-oxoheptanedioate aldolase